MAKRFRSRFAKVGLSDEYGLSRTPLQRAAFERYLSSAIAKSPGSLPIEQAYATACSVLMWHLDIEWIHRYITHVPGFSVRTRNGFLEKELTEHPRATHYTRVIILGEMLLNLRMVPGVESVIDQLRAGQIESAYAELEMARYLATSGTPFRFVVPRGKRGDNYDLELLFPWGEKACADTKCKLETAVFSTQTIENTLAKSRDQLPPHLPGMFFIKIPQQWLPSGASHIGITPAGDSLSYLLEECTNNFFHGTKRIVSVHYLCTYFHLENDNFIQSMGGIELINPYHRFGIEKAWELFRGGRYPVNQSHPIGWRDLTELFVRRGGIRRMKIDPQQH